jgi:hypothetical protein
MASQIEALRRGSKMSWSFKRNTLRPPAVAAQ